MSNSWLFTNILADILLPPTPFIVLGMIGVIQIRRRPALARLLISGSLLCIGLMATPIIANFLLDSLKPPPQTLSAKDADAIVILGGGRNKNALEYGGDTMNRFTIERVRYGAWLARTLDKPVLVTGGAPDRGLSEGEIMKASLQREFGIRNVRWVERKSRNTRENARLSSPLLKQSGIQRIYLVTHAWHLARAIPEFEQLGFEVIPAGTGYRTSETDTLTARDFLPNGKAFLDSWVASHEWLGLLWYRIRN
jgi:uncharacterized SAM-binding protein YcdF (DUF218 family)